MKIGWIKWDLICKPKEYGGSGVRRVGAFNLSLLGKWCWRMLTYKERLWYRVLKVRYVRLGGGCRRVETKVIFGGKWCVGCERGLVRELGIGLMIMSIGWSVGEVLYFGMIIGLGKYL